MRFLIRQISFTADGREIVRTVTLDQPVLSVGRAAECDIALPDLAITPDHARIERVDARHIAVVATGTLGFDLDGRSVLSARIDVATGAELNFGGHRITVSAEGEQIVLTVQRVGTVSESAQDRDEVRAFSLSGLMPGRRMMAWALAMVVLIAFLAVPVASYLTRPAQDTRNIYDVMKEKGAAGDAVLMDASWSSGPLSRAHHALEGKCEACHTQAFVSVRDAACATCHAKVHDHAPPARIAGARAEPGLGGRMLAGVAAAFGKAGPGACVDCHIEHEGAGPMAPTPQAFCTDCHASLNTRLTDTKIGNASDFGTDHPQFRPQVVTAPGPHPRFERVSIDLGPRERSGLKFPHDIHVSRTGGVARMAQRLAGEHGFGDALVCKDCHTPTSDGVRFAPVEMERDCAMCHSLGFEAVGGTIRTLRHGQPAQVIADLRAWARPISAPPLLAGRRRPGERVPGHMRVARGGDPVAAVFSPGGACFDCHIVTPPGASGQWGIAPVHQTARYMAKGWFDHGAHKTEKCATCHAAPTSRSADDLLLPGIKTCRTCHGGEKSGRDVPSSCALCHSYHLDDGAPWQPAGLSQRKHKTTGS